MRNGRPSAYDPSFCAEVVKLGKEGKSVAQMCAHFGICRQTIDNWADAHDDFLEAFTRAKTLMQAKLEEMGFEGLKNKEFNAALWKTTMQARFRNDYTERRVQEHTGPNGGPITTADVTKEHAEEFRSRIAGVASRNGEAETDKQP